MNYTLHQLKVFSYITRLKSITKASEALHLSQPAVSIQLKNLQDQFEIPLTEVIGRNIHITEFGHEVAQSAAVILKEIQNLEQRASLFQNKLVGELNISTVSTGKYILPYLLSYFSSLYPEVKLNIDVTNKAKVKESLERNSIDFALVSVLPKSPQLNYIELLDNNLYWVGSANEHQKFDDVVKDKGLIFREQGSATRQAMENYLITNQYNYKKAYELTSNEAVKQAVIAGLGISLMPLIGVLEEIKTKKIKLLDANDLPIKTQWQIVWIKNKKLGPAASEFLKICGEKKEEILKQHRLGQQRIMSKQKHLK